MLDRSARDPVIVSAARTPVGKFMGGLASLPATRLGALAVREAVKRAGIDAAQHAAQIEILIEGIEQQQEQVDQQRQIGHEAGEAAEEQRRGDVPLHSPHPSRSEQ